MKAIKPVGKIKEAIGSGYSYKQFVDDVGFLSRRVSKNTCDNIKKRRKANAIHNER